MSEQSVYPKVSVRYEGEAIFKERQLIIDELKAIIAQLEDPPTPGKTAETVEFNTNLTTAVEVKFKWRPK